MNGELNDLQFDILDSLYFVEPYINVIEEIDSPEPVIRAELRKMIGTGLVNVLEFNEVKGDYEKTRIYDTDNMHQYAYLASKDGLLKHNGH